MFEPTSWILTVILMYQPTVHISIYEYAHPTVESCMDQRAVALDAYADSIADPKIHVVVGCEPRYD